MKVRDWFFNHNNCVITAYVLTDLTWYECDETGEWFTAPLGILDPDFEIETHLP